MVGATTVKPLSADNLKKKDRLSNAPLSLSQKKGADKFSFIIFMWSFPSVISLGLSAFCERMFIYGVSETK